MVPLTARCSLPAIRLMVSAAVCQPLATKPAENGMARGFLVEMKGLRIELFGEGDDLVLLDPHPPAGPIDFSDNEILEISVSHKSFAPG